MLDLLNEDELLDIREDFKDIMEDPRASVGIIYRRLVSRSLNTGTGIVTPTYTETKIQAFRCDLSAKEVAASGGAYRVGDEIFYFDPSVMDSVPLPDDRILREVSREGHVALSLASDVLTGYNTRFLLDGIHGGDILQITTEGALPVTIKSVSGNVAGILKSSWSQAPESAVEYRIYRVYEIVSRMVDPIKAAVKLVGRRMS